MKIHEDRRKMFESMGRVLVESLNTAELGKTDRQIQGAAGELAFRHWLTKQLPKRYEVYSGTVVSPKDPPVTERDCLIFDAFEHPPFRVSGGEADMFPIEGVAASIELSTGKSGTPYQKIKKDAAKLSAIGQLRGSKRSPLPMWLSEIPSQRDSQFRHRIAVEQEVPDMPPLLLIFIETLRGKLDTLASRIAEHNKRRSLCTE